MSTTLPLRIHHAFRHVKYYLKLYILEIFKRLQIKCQEK